MRFAFALALILAASSGGAVEPADVSVVETPSSIRIETGAARAEIRRNPFRLKLREQGGGRRLFRQQREGLFWERAGIMHSVGNVTGVTAKTPPLGRTVAPVARTEMLIRPLQAAIHHDALLAARPDRDFLLVTRAGYTGTAHWSTVWGGDIPGSTNFGFGPGTDLGLRSAIISQQRAAFMGYPIWGSDTGGYYEFKDREVFARWLEFSAFSGLMEMAAWGSTRRGQCRRRPPTTPR